MMDYGKMILEKEKALLHGQMGISIQVYGRMIKCMVKEL